MQKYWHIFQLISTCRHRLANCDFSRVFFFEDKVHFLGIVVEVQIGSCYWNMRTTTMTVVYCSWKHSKKEFTSDIPRSPFWPSREGVCKPISVPCSDKPSSFLSVVQHNFWFPWSVIHPVWVMVYLMHARYIRAKALRRIGAFSGFCGAGRFAIV